MKLAITFAFGVLFLTMTTAPLSIHAQTGVSELGEVQTLHCTYGGCSVTLDQWHSAPFNSSHWRLTIRCYDENGVSEHISKGSGVWMGSACGGKLGY